MQMLEQQKLNKWINNSLTFLAPLFILYLLTIQEKITNQGFSLEAFEITDTMAGGMSLYIINVALDFFRKYRQ